MKKETGTTGRRIKPSGNKKPLIRMLPPPSRRWYLTNFYAILFVLLLSASLLALPLAIRHFGGNRLMPGDESYYNARIANEISVSGTVPQKDSLSFSGQAYSFNPFHLVLSQAIILLGEEAAPRLLPYLLGIASAVLLFLVLGILDVGLRTRFLATLFFCLSPNFITTFSQPSSSSLAIFLFLLGSYLFLKQSLLLSFFSLLVFLTMPFFGLAYVLGSALILFAASDYLSAWKKYAFVFVPVIIFSFAFRLPQNFGIPLSPSFVVQDRISNFISGVGAEQGIPIFVIIMASIAFFISWKYKKILWKTYVAASLLVLVSFFLQEAVLFANILFSVFAAYTFLRLVKSAWQAETIKSMTLLVLVCGIIFSSTSAAMSIIGDKPDDAMKNALLFLKEDSLGGQNAMSSGGIQDRAVLSHYKNGFWVEYFSGLPAFMDGYYNNLSLVEGNYEAGRAIFASRSLEDTLLLLRKHRIGYIFITPEMREGSTWSKEDEGLLLLLRDKESFRRIYSQDGYEIHKFIA